MCLLHEARGQLRELACPELEQSSRHSSAPSAVRRYLHCVPSLWECYVPMMPRWLSGFLSGWRPLPVGPCFQHSSTPSPPGVPEERGRGSGRGRAILGVHLLLSPGFATCLPCAGSGDTRAGASLSVGRLRHYRFPADANVSTPAHARHMCPPTLHMHTQHVCAYDPHHDIHTTHVHTLHTHTTHLHTHGARIITRTHHICTHNTRVHTCTLTPHT